MRRVGRHALCAAPRAPAGPMRVALLALPILSLQLALPGCDEGSRPRELGDQPSGPGSHETLHDPPVGLAPGVSPDEEAAPREPLSDEERAELLTLAETLRDDPVQVALRDVDEANGDDLPVRASDILRERAIPAASARRDAIAALEPTTPQALELRDRGVEAAEERQAALQQYADALARGLVEDLTLVDAVQRHRRAEAEMAAATARVRALVSD